jgi:L-asparaginase II
MLLIIFLALTAFVASCTPPLNYSKFFGNETHTTTDMIRTLMAQNSGTQLAEVVSLISSCYIPVYIMK